MHNTLIVIVPKRNECDTLNVPSGHSISALVINIHHDNLYIVIVVTFPKVEHRKSVGHDIWKTSTWAIFLAAPWISNLLIWTKHSFTCKEEEEYDHASPCVFCLDGEV
jgi:hypothetical protein